VAAVVAPVRDRTVHCSIGVNAPGVNADEQVAGFGLAGSAQGLVGTTAAGSAAQLREAGCGGERR
jgi:hypothetical protein